VLWPIWSAASSSPDTRYLTVQHDNQSGRTTPSNILSLCHFASVTIAAQPTSRWLFVDVGIGSLIAACPVTTDSLCKTLVLLSQREGPNEGFERKLPRDAITLGSLKVGKFKNDEWLRLNAWVANPEDLGQTDKPKRYAASLVRSSEVSARLDVLDPLNIVPEPRRLMHPVALVAACE
jgi:hypothetical protein